MAARDAGAKEELHQVYGVSERTDGQLANICLWFVLLGYLHSYHKLLIRRCRNVDRYL